MMSVSASEANPAAPKPLKPWPKKPGLRRFWTVHMGDNEEQRITLSEREVRIIAREVAQEVVAALLGQAGLTMEHLIYLRSHAETMKTTGQDVRRLVMSKLFDVGFTAMLVGAGFLVARAFH